ncbi:MAG TPA: bifunctional serine/threonine-protein kinase/formylglycine-generating enzyme family protein [Chthoniobacterales bacterium]|nr:bifunctional serine/threonine-protein kinase/formylglycine-generating enzyme family protein [Chthoniobacterales bacterium]
MPRRRLLCKIGTIPDQVSAQVPVVPDHELLRVIGRGAYGEIWMARTVTGGLRAVKIVYRSTFESERAFLREFEGMSAFEPISRGHAGFVDILHVGRTAEHLYYSMELADDHMAGRNIDLLNYEPRTLKSDLARHKRLSADESIQLGVSLTEALEALHQHGLTHRDIKPSNIIFIDGVPKLADIGLVAASGQQSFVGTEGYVPPEGPGTPQADVFSLGKLLYEVSTGKDRLDFPEIDSQLSQRPDREQLLQLNDVLVKACAQDSKKRYRTAAEMNCDLVALEDGRSPARPKSIWKVLLVIAAILAIGAIAFWRYSGRSGSSTEMHLKTTIRTDPPGALVILGDHAEKSPATFEDLDQRKYRLRIMSPGYDPIETTVDLGALRTPQPSAFHLVRSKGLLQIESDPAGAQFSLRSEDGQTSREGVTPQTIVDLPTGKYSIAAHRGNWEMRDQIEVERGETAKKAFAFVAAPLKITSEPTGAEIVIDGTPRGRTPLQIDLPVTSHQVAAQLTGWPNEEQKIDVAAQQANTAHFVFANGSVKLTSAPGGASVRANGKDLGQTPLVIEEVKPGDVTYELRLSGYNPTTVTGKVDPQQQTFLAARLEKSVGPAPGQPFINSLGMKFVPLGDIRISIWETRVHDYTLFVQTTGRRYEPTDFQQAPNHPIVKVNWFDAVAFCKWLTEKEHDDNLIEERQSYRLPTDREWSLAVGLQNEPGGTPQARDGKIKDQFPWGKQWPAPSGAGNYGTPQKHGATAAVGSFKPNALGLYDLGGNVWEWVADTYKGGTTATGRDWGVLRGGSWATTNKLEMQSSYRNVVDRNERDVIYGFRCVLAAEPAENR